MKMKQRLRRMTLACTLTGAAVIALCACIPQETLMNKTERLSYSIGLQIGKGLGTQRIAIDTESFMRGVNDARSGNKPLLPLEQVRKNIDVFLAEAEAPHAEDGNRSNNLNLFPADVFRSKIITELPDETRIVINY